MIDLEALEADLPPAPKAIGAYLPANRHGPLLFISSVDAEIPAHPLPRGIIGVDISIEAAYAHAARCGQNILSIIRDTAGSLAQVEQVLRVRGALRTGPDFSDHARVLDGCSHLLVEVFGRRGRHARSVIGAASLPGGTTVEIEVLVALKQ